MLTNIADIDRLAESAIRVEHFATMELLSARPDDPISEVLPWMLANEFDVVPLRSVPQPGFVLREDLERLDSRRPVGDARRALDSAVVVRPELSFKEALGHLGTHGWFFVAVEGTLRGIVTRHDLGRPAVSLYLFARVLALEAGLRRLLGTFTNTPLPDSSTLDESETAPHYLSQVMTLIRREDDLVTALGFSTRGEFDRATGFIKGLRNHLAHGRSILSLIDDAKLAVAHIRDLDSLLARVSALAADRDQVWKAFASTQVIHRVVIERYWAGPNAIPLPLPPPVYVITAVNPFEEVLSDTQNAHRNNALRSLLKSRGLKFIEVFGQSPDGKWVEPSFAVSGISRATACALSHLFRQRAFFELDEHEFRVISPDGKVRSARPRKSKPT